MRFPPVCAKTGKTTQAVVDLRVVIMPRWSRLLLLLGVLPWFIARPVIGQGFIARIPLTEDLVARVTKSRADLTAAMLGGVFATIIGSIVPRDDLQVAFVGLGFLIVVGSVTALILGERDYGIDIRPTTWETVMLRRIHPRFRDALVRGDLTINEPSVGRSLRTPRPLRRPLIRGGSSQPGVADRNLSCHRCGDTWCGRASRSPRRILDRHL